MPPWRSVGIAHPARSGSRAMIDWSAFAKDYLETGEWKGPGYAPLDPRTDCPLHVREALGIETDPGLAQPRKPNGRAAEPPPQRNGSAEQATGGSDDGFRAQIRAEMLDYGIETPPVSFIPDGQV